MRLAAAALLVLVAASACSGGSAKPTGQSLEPLRRAAALAPCPAGVGALPSLTLPCLGGGPDVRLDAAPTGVPTLVNVYGSWCGPCQKEMPVLAAFSRRAGSKVALLGVDTEDEQRLALLFARDVGQHWPAVVDDEGKVLRHYAPGPPATLFVDRAGKVVFVQRGPFPSLAALVEKVRTHLGVSV